MNRAWGFYLALQIISNIKNMEMLTIPASARLVVEVLNEMANFKFFQNYYIKSMLRIHIFGNMQDLQQFLLGQGVMFLGVILLVIIGIVVLIFKIVKILVI